MKTTYCKSLFTAVLRYAPTITSGILLLGQMAGAAVPAVVNIGPVENAGSAGWRPAIAADTKGQPHIVVQGDRGVLNFYDKIGDAWSAASVTSSSELNFPRTVIDKHNNRQWVSAIMIQIGDINGCGEAIYTRSNVSVSPSGISGTKHLIGDPSGIPLGMIDLESTKTDLAYVYGNGGYWQEFGVNANGSIRATANGGQKLIYKNLGERNIYGFGISQAPNGGNAVWHASYVGHPDLGSVRYSGYINSTMGSETPWNDPLRYGASAWDEDNYGSLCADAKYPKIAYFAIHGRNGYIWANIYNGSKMLSPITELYAMRSDAGYSRYAPQWAPAKDGGAWLCWENGGNINIKYFGPDAGLGDMVDVGPGIGNGAIACDSDGNLHVTFYYDGYQGYRKITTSGFATVSPKGRITNTSPAFVWADTGTAPDGYRVVVEDATNGLVMDVTVSATVKTVPCTVALAMGSYSWRVARIVGATPFWSEIVPFSVAPAPPKLLYPTGNPGISTPEDLAFSWQELPAAERYQLYIKRDGVAVTSCWIEGSTATNWIPFNPGEWVSGNYSWWVMATNTTLQVGTDWSTVGNFRLTGPAAPVLLSPANRGSVAFTTPLQLVWSAPRGATQYFLYIKKHGVDMWNKVGITSTSWSPGADGEPGNDAFDPDSYQWWVQSTGVFGTGAWSTSNAFFRTGVMAPGNGETLWDLRPQFTWTATAGTTQYRMYIKRDGATFYNSFVGSASTWTPSFDMPHGNYSWWVQAWSNSVAGPWLDPAVFTLADRTPAGSVLVSPTSGILEAAGNTWFQWEAVPRATYYRPQITKDGLAFYGAWLEGVTSNQLALPVGDYQWWVRTWNVDGYGPWTGAGDFSVGKCRPTAPANGTCFTQALPQLQWLGPVAATDHEMYVTRNKVKYLQTKTGSGAQSWTPSAPWPTGNYQWYVRNVGGTWSKPATLSTKWGIPAVVVLVSPISGTQPAGSVNYQWLADVNATDYQLWIKKGSTSYSVWHVKGLQPAGSTLSAAVSGHSSGNYQWWIRARGPDGTGPWSTTSGTFSVP